MNWNKTRIEKEILHGCLDKAYNVCAQLGIIKEDRRWEYPEGVHRRETAILVRGRLYTFSKENGYVVSASFTK